MADPNFGFRIGAPKGVPLPFGEFPIHNFGERITNYRSALGATQAEIAEITGVTRLTVHRWEKGISRPPVTAMNRLVEQMSAIYAWWVTSFAQSARPEPEKLKAMGFKRPANIGQFMEETFIAANEVSELWNAVSFFGGYVTAPRDTWATHFLLPTRQLKEIETAFKRSGEEYVWGFDIGYVLEALGQGTNYRAYLAPKKANRRLLSADIADLRLITEARYRLSYYDLVTRKMPLTQRELAQHATATFLELGNERVRTFPQDLPREPHERKKAHRRLQ